MFLLSRWSGGLVSHYGARIPLVIGPLIATAGYLLFARPSIGGNYWTTFFPAFVVLGLGMAITVAPLTVVVMASMGQDRAGTASGINNAVARVAGVLAIAILGGVMVQAFGHDLHKSLSALNLDPAVARGLESNRVKLAALQVPASVEPNMAAKVQDSISHAFVYAFRWMTTVCAALSAASAVVALLMISSSAEASKSVRS
jgi:MFS family permease